MRFENTAHFREFKNISDFINLAVKAPEDGGGKAMGKSNDWDFNLGFDGAVKLGREGWEEGRKKIAEIANKLFEVVKPKTHQQDINYDFDGSFVDVGLYCDGEPQCFGNFVEPENPTKIIRIEIAGSMSHYITAEVARNRGAAVVALIDLLEAEGYRCELVVVISVKNRPKHLKGHTTAITVKNPDQPLDIDALAFSISHPAFLRRLWFGFVDQESEGIKEDYSFAEDGCYGQPLNVKSDLSDIYIPKADKEHEFEDNESSIKWIKKIIKKHSLLKLESESI